MLTDMPERRMTEIVTKTCSFYDFGMETVTVRGIWLFLETMFREPPTNLGNLYGVGEPVMKDICLTSSDYLCDPIKPPESGGVEDSISIPLIW